MPDRYALIGNPVAHSLSPRIHTLFAQQTGEDITYELLLAPRDGFSDAVAAFVRADGKGMNVTLPFKGEACRIADELGAQATAAQAVNTLVFRADGTIYADNTDGAGLLHDLHRLGCAVAGRTLLVVGAGGACRGIVPALLEAQPRELVIANRTHHRAQKIVEDFAKFGAIGACPMEELATKQFDGVINATSASLSGTVPALPETMAEHLSWGYDLAYADTATPFVCWLRERGVEAAHDGIGMLVAQAAASFHLWRGVHPDVEQTLSTLAS